MLNSRGSLVLGTLMLMILLQVRTEYSSSTLPPVAPPGFVAVTGPHGVTILVGPLQSAPNGGYRREVIVPGRPPFMINTDAGVTPQDIADIYG